MLLYSFLVSPLGRDLSACRDWTWWNRRTLTTCPSLLEDRRLSLWILVLVALVWLPGHLSCDDAVAASKSCLPGPHLHQPNRHGLENSSHFQPGRVAQKVGVDAHSMGSKLDWAAVVLVWACGLFAEQERSQKGTDHQANISWPSPNRSFLDLRCWHDSFHDGTNGCFIWSYFPGGSFNSHLPVWLGSFLCGHEHSAQIFQRPGHHETAAAVHLFWHRSQ